MVTQSATTGEQSRRISRRPLRLPKWCGGSRNQTWRFGDVDDNWTQLSDTPQTFDLLTLQNDATALLGGNELSAGSYTQLRLIVSSASVVSGGVTTPLTVASGAQSGIKVNLDATIEDGMTYTLVIDYNAGQSIKQTGQGLLMTPVIAVKSFTGAPAPSDGSGSGSGSSG